MTLDRRNWSAIAKIEDQELRQFFMTVQHPVVLDGLAQFFPQLFLDELREFCFPLSELTEKELQIDWERDSKECNEQVRIESVRYQWGCAVDAMMIPALLLHALRVPGHQELTDPNCRFLTVPPELQIQL